MPSGGRVDRHPEIHRHRFDHERLGGLYSEVFGEEEPPALILDTGLPRSEEEALLAEARCYATRGPRAGRKFCYAPLAYEEMDRERIRALRRCIEAERPDWGRLPAGAPGRARQGVLAMTAARSPMPSTWSEKRR